MDQYFRFDGHIHFSVDDQERVQTLIDSAMDRNLDLLVSTGFNQMDTHDALRDDKRSKQILNGKYTATTTTDGLIVKVEDCETGKIIYIGRGQEIGTQQGHILAWFNQEPIPENLRLEETLVKIYEENGIVVIPHMYAGLFGGIGKESLIKSIYRGTIKPTESPVAIETVNGQCSWPYNNPNKRAQDTAKHYRITALGCSDTHADYRKEHKKPGIVYTTLPIKKINLDTIPESLKESILYQDERFSPYDGQLNDRFKIEGTPNNVLDVFLWMAQQKGRKLKQKLGI